MGYDIGPQIGIQGEKEFNQQIKTINNNLRECGSEMKSLTSKFKDNASGQEALTAKNKTLQKQYEEQKKKSELLEQQFEKEVNKLKELADAYDKAKKESGENSAEAAKAETAYNKQAESVSKLKVAMNETDGYMNNLRNSIDDNNTKLSEMEAGTRDAATGLSNLADSADEAGDQLESIGDKLDAGNLMQAAENLSGVGDAIVDMGGKAVASFQSIEDATVSVNASLGATGQEAETNADIMKAVYENGLGGSIDSVAEAVTLVRRNMKDLNEEDLQSITSQALVLEDVLGSDMEETLRGAKALMINFGLSGQEAMDLISLGTQNGLDWTHELGDNISEYSAAFALAGYSAEEYFQILQNDADAGAHNLDKINDAINEVTNKLADGSIERNLELFSGGTQNLFKEWQIGGATQKEVIDSIVTDIRNCTNEQDAMRMSAEAFGSMGEDFGLDFIRNLSFVGDAYKDTSGKANQLVDDTNSSSRELEAASRKIQDAFAPIGGSIATILTSIAPVVEVVANVIAKFADLPQPIQIVIIAIAGVLAAISKIAPALAALKAIGFASSLGSIASTIAGTVIPAIAGGIAAIAPVLIVIAAVVAAIAGVIVVIKNWGAICDWFKEHVGPIIESVKGFFTGMGDKIGEVKDKAVNKFTEMKDVEGAYSDLWLKKGKNKIEITNRFTLKVTPNWRSI